MALTTENLSQRGEDLLDAVQAAQHVGFTEGSFRLWVRRSLLPPASVRGAFWTAAEIEYAVDLLQREGYQPCIVAYKKHQHFTLPRVHPPHRKVNDGGYNGFKRYYYFRPTGEAITGAPGSPEFMRGLIACERLYTALQKEHLPTQPKNEAVETPSGSSDERPHDEPTLSSDAVLHMGGAAPSDHELPLYPTEYQIACAVVGTERAAEWPALAARLAKQGLPPIDPTVNARFWPAVQAYFEARHGLAPRFAFDQRTSLVPARTKGSFRSPKPAEPVYAPNAPGPSMYLRADELVERWRHVLTTETLKNHRSKKVGVPFVTIGRKPLYRLSDVEEFEKQQLNPKHRS